MAILDDLLKAPGICGGKFNVRPPPARRGVQKKPLKVVALSKDACKAIEAEVALEKLTNLQYRNHYECAQRGGS